MLKTFIQKRKSGKNDVDCLSRRLATTSSKRENPTKATTTGAKRDPKPLPRDPITDAIIRPRKSDGNLIVRTRKTN